MNSLTKYLKVVYSCGRRNLSTKRKFPVEPRSTDHLPVFDYSPAKKHRVRVYAWGYAQTGALGLGLKEEKNKIRANYTFPKRLTFTEQHEVCNVATGFGFTAFSIKAGVGHKLYATGINTDSQIGYHILNKNGKHLDAILTPQQVNIPQSKEDLIVLKLSAGRAHLLVLTNEGLFTFGNNAYGQCGRDIITNEKYNGSQYVHKIAEIDHRRIVDVKAGQDHSLVITEDGKVYGSGWGADGQTGLGHYNVSSSFTSVKGDIENEEIVKLACSSDFVLALSKKGELFGWGNTEYGQIPGYNGQQCCNPKFIDTGNIGPIKSIASGGSFCIAVNENGHVYVWGYGLLGMGPNVMKSPKPVQLEPTLFGQNQFNINSKVTSVAAGLFHLAAVTNNGELYTWGQNKCGCLGFGNDKPQYFPLKVAIGASVKEVHCGADHTIALCTAHI